MAELNERETAAEEIRGSAGGARRLTQPGTVLGAILVVGLVAIVGGVQQLRRSISNPFLPSSAGRATADAGAVAQLSRDTDGDGLNDYDELNRYGSSPYVADSDSDGQLDGAEVQAGTDPNCPAGGDCRSLLGAEPEPEPTSGGSSATSTVLEGSGGGELPTIAELRQLLLQAGLSQEQLDQLTDEQIEEAWNEILSSQTGA